jgi:hypothetical protein
VAAWLTMVGQGRYVGRRVAPRGHGRDHSLTALSLPPLAIYRSINLKRSAGLVWPLSTSEECCIVVRLNTWVCVLFLFSGDQPGREEMTGKKTTTTHPNPILARCSDNLSRIKLNGGDGVFVLERVGDIARPQVPHFHRLVEASADEVVLVELKACDWCGVAN